MAIPHVRLLTTPDLKEVARLQTLAYESRFHEPVEAFRAKLIAAPASCWIAEMAGTPVGYLITLPLHDQDGLPLPALSDARTVQTHPQANWLYLHDLAVDPQYRGIGIADKLIARALCYATQHDIPQLGLIAVQASEAFWNRHGFQRMAAPDPVVASKLRSFGSDALFMTQRLSKVCGKSIHTID